MQQHNKGVSDVNEVVGSSPQPYPRAISKSRVQDLNDERARYARKSGEYAIGKIGSIAYDDEHGEEHYSNYISNFERNQKQFRDGLAHRDRKQGEIYKRQARSDLKSHAMA